MNSVLIKGMKKPTACYKCPLRTGKYCGILTENEKCADDGILPHCPIVEVPTPHGRLIDAVVFEEMLNSKGGVKLKDAPTVIESEEQ